ncbi:hypothetical protein DH2020_039415 [Rehmannia glutinosa]|uniref:C3H1-type domain-containing protein n=1 Tax=Rehmannia glutinosa TaxID=99300 RepID=A0ABR0UX28_REHGL
MMNLAPPPASRPVPTPLPDQNGSATPPAVKAKLCNRYKSAEGCKFGNNCNFAHGEWELGKPIILQSQEDPRSIGSIPGRFGARVEPPVPGPVASFGASATAKISVAASLVGAVIGKGGVNSKQICRQTGGKLAVREHEMDPNLRNIELEGTVEQIQQASGMVRELIVRIGSAFGPGKAVGVSWGPIAAGSNFKTKLCENFSKGSCTFGISAILLMGRVSCKGTSTRLRSFEELSGKGLKQTTVMYTIIIHGLVSHERLNGMS